MCLLVWVGSECALEPHAPPARDAPDTALGWFAVEPVPSDAAVRARFDTPHVTYVGSHQGCGCGFNADSFTFAGFTRFAELDALLPALADDERSELEAVERSRARLVACLRHAERAGHVQVYACWDGDQALEALREERVEAAWFTRELGPIEERVRYEVVAPVPSSSSSCGAA